MSKKRPTKGLSEELFSKIANALPGFAFVKDADLRFMWVNDALAKSLQSTPENIIGKTDSEIYELTFSERFMQHDRAVIDEGKSFTSEEMFTPPGGKPLLLKTVKMPLISNSGEALVLGISTEVTNVDELQAELARQKQALKDAEALLKQIAENSTRSDKLRKPLVFISYKHGKEDANSWVQTFAKDLKRRYKIRTLLDDFELDYGDSIQSYMQRIQTEATHVIFVITTESVRAVANNAGGVAFEIQLAAALRDQNRIRLIPVFREGTETPAYVRQHRYIDFRDDSLYFEMLKRLADSILDRRQRL